MMIRKNVSNVDEVCASALSWSDKICSGCFTGKAKRWINGSEDYGIIKLLFPQLLEIITYISE